jgi:hypothetical protein
MFDQYFYLISAIVIHASHLKVKTIFLYHQHCEYFTRENFQNLRQKC